MRYKLGLQSETFAPAVEAFDALMLETLRKMRKQGISEGSVTLKIGIEIEEQFPVDDDGKERELYLPVFEHEASAQLVQKSKRSGKIAEDFVLVIGKDGLPTLVSRDTDNLFDMVGDAEGGGGNDGAVTG